MRMTRTTPSASRTRRPTGGGGGRRWCRSHTAPPKPCSRGGPQGCTRKAASAKPPSHEDALTPCRKKE
ncbi:hypothetical protein LSCM1_04541 [Leishmania martiniquensis]|uniref:Uncharacterized protein n=1 Tax=Leishmania martiniquensis TaxID=1580590 RepID=A0A836HA63_9TRYP|nr:hypothetical protein LSCM1_04541 [Leishmania martiniquensis]